MVTRRLLWRVLEITQYDEDISSSCPDNKPVELIKPILLGYLDNISSIYLLGIDNTLKHSYLYSFYFDDTDTICGKLLYSSSSFSEAYAYFKSLDTIFDLSTLKGTI